MRHFVRLWRSSSLASQKRLRVASISSEARTECFDCSSKRIFDEDQDSDSPSWTVGDSARQQTPKCCHSRNQGLLASVSSCLRFAAEMSLALRGLVSGSAKMRSSHSISTMVFSASTDHGRKSSDSGVARTEYQQHRGTGRLPESCANSPLSFAPIVHAKSCLYGNVQ